MQPQQSFTYHQPSKEVCACACVCVLHVRVCACVCVHVCARLVAPNFEMDMYMHSENIFNYINLCRILFLVVLDPIYLFQLILNHQPIGREAVCGTPNETRLKSKSYIYSLTVYTRWVPLYKLHHCYFIFQAKGTVCCTV